MARAFINRQPDYTDLDLDFLRNPTTGDVVRKTGEEAIKRSIRNLIFTNFYDRPFQSYIGSGIRALLFENATNFTADQIQSSITDVINNFEPRVSVVEVVVTPDYDRNGFNVQLTYVIKNREQPVITSIFLERVR
jgi:phage baseplate assembly protein W